MPNDADAGVAFWVRWWLGVAAMNRWKAILVVGWCSAVGLPAACGAADWPMYRADAARSGYTPEALPEGLSLAWSYRAAAGPSPAWPGSDRMTFDRAFQPVIAGSMLYFGSSADGKVCALDAATGAERWTHYTDGPIRLAPVAWKDRVTVAGDDGYLVCLRADDGRPLWRLRGGPRADMILGNDRMISRWPFRGGPVVADDVLYVAAGIWPSEGIFIYALDPISGKVLWRNDSSGAIEMDQPHPGARARSGVAAQGYLAVAGDALVVPTGRAVPAVFDRASGRFRSFPLQAYGKLGGADVVAFDGQLFNHGMLFSAEKDVKPQALGPQIALHPQWVVSCRKEKLFVYDRRTLWVAASTVDRKGRTIATKALSPPAWSATLPHLGEAAMIVAGDKIVVGGPDRVSLVDAGSRRAVWTAEVEGTAYGLAVAHGKLYASTDRGRLYCFQRSESAAQGTPHVPPARQQAASSPPSDPAGSASAAADEILRLAGVREGYCLDLGCGDGRLTIGLARRTGLRLVAVDPDAANVAALRRTLDAAGLLGTRVTVHQADLDKVPCPRWFADLVVSGRSITEGEGAVPTAAVRRFQRPWGGVACLGRPGAMKVSSRGPLEGEGRWTHQYSDPANTLCSGDDRLRGPLAVLWFRDTDLVMPNRHGRGPAPLVSQGRMFVEGLDALRAVNIYNGRTLWQVPLPGILGPYHQEHLMGVAGTGSNFCLGGDRLYVRSGAECLCLRAEDGSRAGTLRAPPRPDGKPATWAFIACEGNTLFGSLVNDEHLVRYRFGRSDMSRLFTESLLLFAIDVRTGGVRWTYTPRHSIRHNAIAIGGGRVYLIDRPLAEIDDVRFGAAKTAQKSKPAGASGTAKTAQAARRVAEHKPGRLVALDAQTGRVAWEVGTDVFGTLLALSTKHDVLWMGYQSTRFQLDSERGGRMAAYRASDGTRLWDAAARYASRPILNDRTIYAQPGAWELLTGRQLPLELTRSYGCGILAGSSRMLVFRSATLGYVDLGGNRRTENYGGIRPGCWVNAIPAGGLVLLADAASWCTCSYLNQATIALEPAEE